MVNYVLLNGAGQVVHRYQAPEGYAVPEGYVLAAGQPDAPDAWRDFHQAVTAGCLVQPEGFILALGDEHRAQFGQMLALVKEALDLGMITNDTPQSIADQSGAMHELTTLRFRQVMVIYGMHYKGLWDAAKLAEAQA